MFLILKLIFSISQKKNLNHVFIITNFKIYSFNVLMHHEITDAEK